jgi:hypothetical protein
MYFLRGSSLGNNASLLGEKVVKQYPIIEICGGVDCYKTEIAALLAKRIGAVFLSFPILAYHSHVGQAWLKSPATDLRLNQFLYLSLVQSFAVQIRKASTLQPVVVVNYTSAIRGWSSVLLDDKEFGSKLDVPKSNHVYTVFGAKRPQVIKEFDPDVINKVDSYFTNKDRYIGRKNTFNLSGGASLIYQTINEIVDDMILQLPIKEKKRYIYDSAFRPFPTRKRKRSDNPRP